MERLTQTYYRLPPWLRSRIPLGWKAVIRDRVLPGLGGSPAVWALDAKLWGGFSRSARETLAELALAPASRPWEAAEASLALARWEGAAGAFEAALGWVRHARALTPRIARDRRSITFEALFLCRLGQGRAARALLDRGAGQLSDPARALLRATAWLSDSPRGPAAETRALDAINALFRRAGLMALRKRDPAAPLSLDNLAGTETRAAAGPRVSIIVPMHDAAATIATTLSGLTAQTHADLEILVVDDASTDAGPDIVAAMAASDPRIRLIRSAGNRGPYAARNRALAEATGTFVTVQDADDWSHPERIARHLAAATRRDVPYTISAWARASDDLRFWGPWRPSPNLTTLDFSSVFFRRDLIGRAGPWDTARISADREFATRLARLHGKSPPRPIIGGCPLAFGRIGTGSLTRAGATHAATLLHGVRREYREAADLWHNGLTASWSTAGRLEPPLFPAPLAIRAEREPRPHHDLLFIADFNLRGGAFHSVAQMIRAGLAAGLDSAVLHYRRYDLDPTRPLDPDFRRFCWENAVRIVAPGETIAARTVIVGYPPVLDNVMDRFPRVAHDCLVVVVNQMAERDREGRDQAYDPARVRAHLVELLGTEGLWVPISERVRAIMTADPRYPRPSTETWMPLIDLAEWLEPRPRWRAASAPRPVIGRHGRDHPLKWPVDPADLHAAYCAGRPCTVRFLGGAHWAKARLGRMPRNWQVEAFGAEDVRAFLSGLDVFVHYPDPAYIEEFGRAPMEAMAVGVPVILPPAFAPTFGPAALYATPDGVWPIVERLWNDRAFWQTRVAAGRAFVIEHCSYDDFSRRLAQIAKTATGTHVTPPSGP